MKDLTKINEEVLLKTPVFTVVKKTFEETKFQPVGLNCNDWVSIVAIDDFTNPVCVFVEQTRWGKEKKTIEFPCGTVEDGEDPTDAAVREFEEETGIEIANTKCKLHYCGSFNPNPAYFNNLMHVFLYKDADLISMFLNRGKQHLDKDEDCKVFIDRLRNVVYEVNKGGMGRAILGTAQDASDLTWK
jgi:8-oxo-dGTP pyrophosphatase MutT (NUDIX family)